MLLVTENVFTHLGKDLAHFLKFTPFEQGDLGFWGLCLQDLHSLH